VALLRWPQLQNRRQLLLQQAQLLHPLLLQQAQLWHP
jgi:hypothetical protein